MMKIQMFGRSVLCCQVPFIQAVYIKIKKSSLNPFFLLVPFCTDILLHSFIIILGCCLWCGCMCRIWWPCFSSFSWRYVLSF
jgi:hypothetical protein